MLGFTLFQDLQAQGRETYPAETVVGGFADPDGAEPVLSALVENFGTFNVCVLFGPDGLRRLDPEGHHDGLTGGEYLASDAAVTDSRGTRQQIATLRRGGYLVYVDVADEKQKKCAVEITKAHGADHVVHLGRAAIEHL